MVGYTIQLPAISDMLNLPKYLMHIILDYSVHAFEIVPQLHLLVHLLFFFILKRNISSTYVPKLVEILFNYSAHIYRQHVGTLVHKPISIMQYNNNNYYYYLSSERSVCSNLNIGLF